MISWYKLPAAIAVALMVSAFAQADLMLVSEPSVEVGQRVSARSEEANTHPNVSYRVFESRSVADFEPNPISISTQLAKDFSELSLTPDAQILTDGQKSFHLCLSALIGLGLCSSAHCLKKVNFGFIPEWYHNGGPYQIGHSLAVNPDSVCPVPVYCFIQPDHETEDHIPITRLRDMISLWRQSQYTPDVIASRGPPVTC